jgi:uncharacterized Zn finger protein
VGLQAKSLRGTFGESWWGRRWTDVLDRLGWANRLERGRNYARRGQVVSLSIRPGQAEGRVQGSRPKPYQVSIYLKQLTDEQWERAIDAMAEQAIFAARLLAGEMPPNIEEAFESAGVPLFPNAARDLHTMCSCPDVANPCKHAAAVYYLLGERFDEDPFMLFVLRGRTREQVMDGLRRRRASAARETPVARPAPLAANDAPPPLRVEGFYQAGPELETVRAQLAPPAVPGAVLAPLGPAPAGAETDLQRLLQVMSMAILQMVLGE